MTSPVQQFTRDVLSRHGALVDPAGDGALDVVASLDLQARLGLADYQRLVFSPDATGPGQLVDYDSPLLEQMGRLGGTVVGTATRRSWAIGVDLCGKTASSKPATLRCFIEEALENAIGVFLMSNRYGLELARCNHRLFVPNHTKSQ